MARKDLETVTEALDATVFDSDGNMRREARTENKDWRQRFLESFSAEVQRQVDEDPNLLPAITSARTVLNQMLEEEAWRLVFEPPQRPVYQRGELVGFEPMVQTKHIQFMLERHIPERYHLATKTELSAAGGASVSFAFKMGDTIDGEEIEDAELDEG